MSTPTPPVPQTPAEKALNDAQIKQAEAEKARLAAEEKAAKAAADQLAKDQQAAAAERAKTPLEVVGRAGGPFNIRGEGFGPSKGVLTIGGRYIEEITRWDDTQIRGVLPQGVKGEVVLQLGDGTSRHGEFPSKKPQEARTVSILIDGKKVTGQLVQ